MKEIYVTKKIRHFLYALLVYNLMVVSIFADLFDPKFCHIVEIPFVIFMFYCMNIKKMVVQNKYAQVFLIILAAWFLIIIANNYNGLLANLGLTIIDNQGLSCMAMLFVVSQFASPRYLRYILRYSYVCIVLYVFLLIYKIPTIQSLFFQNEMVHADTIFEGLHTYLGGGLLFLVLFQKYLPQRERYVVNIVVVVTLLVAALLGRRGVLLIYLIVYSFYAYLYIKKYSKKKFWSILFISIILYVGYAGIYSYGEQYFAVLYDRFLEDTRSETENELLYDLKKSGDLVIGRGLSGTYKSLFLDESNRTGIETGYLNMVLKGGWIYVIVYFAFILPAIYLGFFKSQNLVVKIMAIYAFVWFFYFNTASSNMSTSIRYFLFLYCIFICYNRKYREMDDKSMFNYLEFNDERKI